MQFIPGYNTDVAVEARYTKQNTSTLPFKFRISSKKIQQHRHSLPPAKSPKDREPVSQAPAPQ